MDWFSDFALCLLAWGCIVRLKFSWYSRGVPSDLGIWCWFVREVLVTRKFRFEIALSDLQNKGFAAFGFVVYWLLSWVVRLCSRLAICGFLGEGIQACQRNGGLVAGGRGSFTLHYGGLGCMVCRCSSFRWTEICGWMAWVVVLGFVSCWTLWVMVIVA